ncbi:MAG: hypothetical protein IH612_12415 [Desulfofustis sp.]|nr:hypothetical protein [Desulfofustis sp.]
MMISVSDKALVQLAQLLAAEGGAGSAIRIAVMGGTGSGPGLGLVVDSAGEADQVFWFEKVALIVDRGLLAYCRNIHIDFSEGQQGSCAGKNGAGFLISPDTPINI